MILQRTACDDQQNTRNSLGTDCANLVSVTPEQLQERSLQFAIAVHRFIRPLFRSPETRHAADQLHRASSSVAANYRAACLARSSREWLAKLGLVREESDESVFWLVYIERAEIWPGDPKALVVLLDEARQLAKIFSASYRTSLANGDCRRAIPGRSVASEARRNTDGRGERSEAGSLNDRRVPSEPPHPTSNGSMDR